MKFLIMGPPGAGKGSQAARIKNHLDITSISTGQMFRDAYKAGDPIGIKAMTYIEDGNLVDDKTTNNIVWQRLTSDEQLENFILDGYPRTVNQAKALDDMLDKLDTKLDGVLNILISEDVLFERMEQRRVCKDCGATYHLTFKPPIKEGVCDVCGGALYQRQDDKHESVKNRLEIYKNKTKPLLDYYDKKGILYNINGMQSFENVHEDIMLVLEDL
ncbi:MAG: adenylate kinase [Candidatus Izimaplasma sp.]|nr:adenylate kinase [Candidatus Izimaplasma bacterium]